MSLAPEHTAMLEASAISTEVAGERPYVSIAPGSIYDWRELAGAIHSDRMLRNILHRGALAFPLYRLGAATPFTWVLRPEQPRINDSGKPIKYEYQRGVGNVFDVLPRYRDALKDPTVPLWITEGAKKADSLATAYGAAIVPVNENGVWGWRGRNSKGGKTAVEDLDFIAWEGRRIVIAPDGDVRFNKDVQNAVHRLARALVGKYGATEVLILHLPNPANGPKIGVDDYLGQGHSIGELESHLTTLHTVSATACVPLIAHPETGEKLYLPSGYDVVAQSIVTRDKMGNERPVYSGNIYVRDLGVDLITGEQQATIAWNGRGAFHGEKTIPYAALSDSRAFSGLVGAAGAAVHPKNIKDVQALLVEFVQTNAEALPVRRHADRLGMAAGGLVLPAGAVGFSEPVRYTGQPTVQIGTDAEAYPAAVRAALAQWPDAWPFWLALGLSLAAPALARMRPRRYPVLYLSGGSGSGKTTILQFATGCWGVPTRQPLRMEAGRTTTAGIFQGLDQLGGLPLLIDEAHTVPEPKKIEQAAYAFANGQRYTTGGADGKTRGGGELGGALLLAGEAIPEFKHAGARLRVLWADANAWLPLGVEARTEEGGKRAAILEAAWESGAGLFGLAIASAIWADWPGFVADVRDLETAEPLVPLQAWRTPLAAAAAALNIAFRVIGVQELPPIFNELLGHWAVMLTSGQGETDPATDAWEALVTMLAQGRRHDDSHEDAESGGYVPPTWEWIEADRGGGLIACRKIADGFWRVLPSSPQFSERIGKAAVQLHGQTWLRRGWIEPAKDNKATEFMRTHRGEGVRMLKVPLSALDKWGNVAP